MRLHTQVGGGGLALLLLTRLFGRDDQQLVQLNRGFLSGHGDLRRGVRGVRLQLVVVVVRTRDLRMTVVPVVVDPVFSLLARGLLLLVRLVFLGFELELV